MRRRERWEEKREFVRGVRERSCGWRGSRGGGNGDEMEMVGPLIHDSGFEVWRINGGGGGGGEVEEKRRGRQCGWGCRCEATDSYLRVEEKVVEVVMVVMEGRYMRRGEEGDGDEHRYDGGHWFMVVGFGGLENRWRRW